jgi:hypothetical protein
MPGAIPPLPNTSSWRGAELSAGTTLRLPTYLVLSIFFLGETVLG